MENNELQELEKLGFNQSNKQNSDIFESCQNLKECIFQTTPYSWFEKYGTGTTNKESIKLNNQNNRFVSDSEIIKKHMRSLFLKQYEDLKIKEMKDKDDRRLCVIWKSWTMNLCGWWIAKDAEISKIHKFIKKNIK